MGQYISIIVAFVLALLVAFYKCVEEDDQGTPIYDYGWIPRLTRQGKLIVLCLLASFSVSLWTTWESSRDSRKNQEQLRQELADHKKKLDQSLSEQRQLQDQLQIARKETIRGYEQVLQEQQKAQAKNLSKFESVLRTQERAAARIGEALEKSAESVQRATLARLTPAKSFRVELFFSDLEVGLAPSSERVSHRDEELKAVLCALPTGVSRTLFMIPLAESQSLEFVVIVDKHESGRCELHRWLWAFRQGKGWSEREILSGDGSAHNRTLKRLVYWTHVDETDWESLDLFPALTFDSFGIKKARVRFHIYFNPPEDNKGNVENLARALPKTIGLNIIPDSVRTEFQIASIFALDPTPELESKRCTFYFKPSGTTAKWDLREFLSLPK